VCVVCVCALLLLALCEVHAVVFSSVRGQFGSFLPARYTNGVKFGME